MSLYEATWTDAPSVLLSAFTAGEALHYIRQTFGESALYQLDDLVEIKMSNFLLARRCGTIHTHTITPSYGVCEEANNRVFLVESRKPNPFPLSGKRDYAALVVDHLCELPALLLWHFDYLTEEESLDKEAVLETWPKIAQDFQLSEINTSKPGVLLSYEYCSCSAPIQAYAPRNTSYRKTERD